MLTHMLRGIIYALSRPDYLKSGLKSLGKQHQQYGVKHEHYPLIRDVLLKTIEEQLGEAYTSEVKTAWTLAINLIIKEMDVA